MYINTDDHIYKTSTTSGGASIVEYVGRYKRVNLSAPKNMIAIGEQINVNAAWEKFDVTEGRYIPDIDNTDDFILLIGDEQITLPVDEPLLVYSTVELGNVNFSAVNPGCGSVPLVLRVGLDSQKSDIEVLKEENDNLKSILQEQTQAFSDFLDFYFAANPE
jgi:hypothetical protein